MWHSKCLVFMIAKDLIPEIGSKSFAIKEAPSMSA